VGLKAAMMAGLVLGLLGAAQAAEAARPQRAGAECRLTEITGQVANRTGVPVTIVNDGHGAGDRWCKRPSRRVAAHSTATIGIIGSNTAGTEVHITYRLRNGDEFRFDARLGYPLAHEQTSCFAAKLVTTARSYRCEAEIKGRALNRNEHAVFTLVSVASPHLRHKLPPPIGKPQLCGSATSIDGFTSNRTNEPITFVSYGIGATNAWCQLPELNQTPPGGIDNWKVGDTVFGTSVDVVYSVPGGLPLPDEFEFWANVNFIFGGGSASCASIVNDYQQPSGKYTCRATWTQGFSAYHPSVTFQILPASSSRR
jgi:hypothetical protein